MQSHCRSPIVPLEVRRWVHPEVAANGDSGQSSHPADLLQRFLVCQVRHDHSRRAAGESQYYRAPQPPGFREKIGLQQVVEGDHDGQAGDARQEMNGKGHAVGQGLVLEINYLQLKLLCQLQNFEQGGECPAGNDGMKEVGRRKKEEASQAGWSSLRE
jgi:hypothetical protein